ncbi:hypothetical protein QJS10_CPA09g00258 [Acorus calamus]|uniref:Uncharacterized protein n=1 Tax=Acorus calamus TaxID=4465 RepID=A0AAV9E3F8_ACOCL|nr:hypothetical protein QJS10_CPA09g00258 [Acorus calamus]
MAKKRKEPLENQNISSEEVITVKKRKEPLEPLNMEIRDGNSQTWLKKLLKEKRFYANCKCHSSGEDNPLKHLGRETMMLYTLRIPANYLQFTTTTSDVRKVTPPINSAHWLARQRLKEKKLIRAWTIEYEGLEKKIEVLQYEIKRAEKTRQKKLNRLMIMEIHGRVVCDVCGDSSFNPEGIPLEGQTFTSLGPFLRRQGGQESAAETRLLRGGGGGVREAERGRPVRLGTLRGLNLSHAFHGPLHVCKFDSMRTSA